MFIYMIGYPQPYCWVRKIMRLSPLFLLLLLILARVPGAEASGHRSFSFSRHRDNYNKRQGDYAAEAQSNMQSGEWTDLNGRC